jgi:hypothetical protein
MLFWRICFVMFLRIMICRFDLSGIRMILLFGIIEVFFILLRISPFSGNGVNVRNDYDAVRTGDRVVSLGEHPYFDPASKSRREALKA